MKLRLQRCSVLLAGLAVGCFQPKQPLRNGFLTPELESPRPVNAALPVEMSEPARVVVDTTDSPSVALAEAEPEHKPVPRKKLRVEPHVDATQQAMNLQPEVSAMGELSTTDDVAVSPGQISTELARVEDALNRMHRTLTRQEQRTVAQIREFVKEARVALAGGDADGAATLANKAKILLRELNP